MNGTREAKAEWYNRAVASLCGLLVAWCMCCATSTAALAAEPQRIISLAPSVTETIFALGVGDRLVGVSAYCDYPPQAEHIARVGTFLTPNVEAILAKHPDLVVAVPSPGNRNPVESVQRLGVHVLVIDPTTVAEIKESILTIGRAVGREAAARELVARIDGQFAAVTARVGNVPPRKVLMVVGQTPLIAVGPNTFQSELIEQARGFNVAATAGGAWPHLSLEYAIASAPEVIIDTTMGNEERAGAGAAMAFWSAFPAIPAVRDGRVYGYKAYQLLRPGPRIGDAFEAIARFIHPERFK